MRAGQPEGNILTKSKQPKTTAKKPVNQTGELPDAALNQASGGALNAYMPTDQTVAHGSGGGSGIVLADPPGEITVRTLKSN